MLVRSLSRAVISLGGNLEAQEIFDRVMHLDLPIRLKWLAVALSLSFTGENSHI